MSLPPDAYINRELSWLEFNQRVLDSATDSRVPLLERLKFLAITASNLDEFFMVRVGGLQMQYDQGLTRVDPSGKTAGEQLTAVHARANKLVDKIYDCFLNEVEPALAEQDFIRVRMQDAPSRQRQAAERIFRDEILPVVSPIALEPENPFPLLINQGLYLAVRIADEEYERGWQLCLVPLCRAIPRCITLAAEKGYAYVLAEDIVANSIEMLFPGREIIECVPFRISRNLDISVREDEAADLRSGMEAVLHQRRTADCIRLEIGHTASEDLCELLRTQLELDGRDVFRIYGPIDLTCMFAVADIKGFVSHQNEAWPPQRSSLIDPSISMFETLAARNVLLCHPYETFDPVVRLIEEAAKDDDVLSIKQVLYRTSRRSAIIKALKEAAERGKYVTVIVELKARFDEARNIEWARELEAAGVQVIYGVRGLKTHAKICLIVRRESHGIQRYMHFGTGNYNESTARLYSDISFLTTDEELGRDASAFFNAITGNSQPSNYAQIAAAPTGLRKSIVEMIVTETERKRQGQKALIAAKLNSLVDPEIIAALYEASQAGVTIRLNIRGVCCLRPGVPGLSENITVVSIVDRFLEHARIIYFHHGGDDNVFISSADWMPRNLDRRIELLVPINDTASKRRLVEILDTYFRDNTNAWKLKSDGSFVREVPKGKNAFRSQKVLYDHCRESVRQAEAVRRATFEPHQANEKE
jgi:polyphosphate kinase